MTTLYHYRNYYCSLCSFQDPDEPLPATNHVSWHIERPVALQTAKAGPLAQKPMTMMTVLRDAANRHPNKLAYGESRPNGD